VVISVYGNRDYDDALLEMKDILSERGFNVIAAGAFIGEHTYSKNVGGGRPDEKDMDYADKLAEAIVNKINSINDGEAIGDFNVAGNTPYKERKAGAKFAPVTNENCIKCGICVKRCPVDAIPSEDPTRSDEEICIRCSACIKYCPQNARSYEPGKMDQTVAWLEANFTARREPEIFA